jgi:hypothetical protein
VSRAICSSSRYLLQSEPVYRVGQVDEVIFLCRCRILAAK